MKAPQVGVAAFTKALKLTVKFQPLVGRIPLVRITCTPKFHKANGNGFTYAYTRYVLP